MKKSSSVEQSAQRDSASRLGGEDQRVSEAGENSHLLSGVRVLELADELGEYCGKVLAGLGADVIKIEPPGGEVTRSYGPFYHDEPHQDRSLHFWHYNLGKRGVVIDLDTVDGQSEFSKLASEADIVIDTRPFGYLDHRNIGYEALRDLNQGLIFGRISPFGDDGPWSQFKGSDLIHLALGGMMMNCGYDAETTGYYDTPPVAPQMWHAYHMTGEVMAIQLMAALVYRNETGVGQHLSASVHESVAKNTEQDVPNWIYSRLQHFRQTCRHSFPTARTWGEAAAVGAGLPGIARTKDGRWMLSYQTYLPGFSPFQGILRVLKQFGAEQDLTDPKYLDPDFLRRPENAAHVNFVVEAFVGKFLYRRDLWKTGQIEGLPWAPLRRPEENLDDEHWRVRKTVGKVEYPELGETFIQVTGKWYSPDAPWPQLHRAPLLGEHNGQGFADTEPKGRPAARCSAKAALLSPHGKPFALQGVRIVDLSWFLASAGSGRFFTALGAEVIKVEHISRLDSMRMGAGVPPPGGREERDRATGPLFNKAEINRSGSFMDINAGKRGFSLNLKHPRGKELLLRLIRDADMVIEGFSPGTMERMGLGYDRLREINPRIIYVQQSGMGQKGTYGQLRSFGPTAQAFSGLSEMSGLPEPFAPAGIGYSYLDWFGAYQMATAMMAALYRQRATGKGCWIDSSQVEAGLYLTGTAMLDYEVNGRRWQRYGNRSPFKLAAPHGAYRTQGEDRWIAIAAFTEAHWQAIAEVLGAHDWLTDARFAALADRLTNQDDLDGLVEGATKNWNGFELMRALQARGVPAGVCQTAQDRCEDDPQLRHLKWLVDLPQSEIGTWPVKEVPVKFSETPPFIGGVVGRHGPNYGEDNDYILRDVLGLSEFEIAQLTADGVF
jgi:crotonobetainyl-CoA:carnitine CoA-transferase CaiB-like acyl-CoA transferase